MNQFDINSYIDGLEMEELWNDEYHSLNGCVDYWEAA